MPKLSVIVPSVRTENLTKLYWSCLSSLQDTFEFIVVSPHDFKEWPNPSPHVKWIKSFRSPNACQQQGLMEATGEYISFASDDGEYLAGALDQAIRLIESSDCMIVNQHKTIIVGKYLEGDNPHPDMEKEDYYKFKYHKTYRLKGVPQNDLIFNCGIISNSFIRELGGWDSENFEATTMAHADLGIRAMKAGAEMILMNQPMFKCSHQPGNTGDHRPINQAMKRDIKNFNKIYTKPNDRINIHLDNWQYTPEIWKGRFK